MSNSVQESLGGGVAGGDAESRELPEDHWPVVVEALRFAAKCASEDDNAQSAIIAHEAAEKLDEQ